MSATVDWWGEKLPVFNHLYNCTWLNERGAELAVYLRWLDGNNGVDLEVGNVTGHYESIPRPGMVVDRYEAAEGIRNMDVFDLVGTFDTIAAISTMEHVRWDEEPRLDGGSAEGIAFLRSLLTPHGRMLVTIPTGHNPPLDEWLLSGETGATRACTLVRDMLSWRQTPEVEIRPYAVTQPWAEAVWIGEFSA